MLNLLRDAGALQGTLRSGDARGRHDDAILPDRTGHRGARVVRAAIADAVALEELSRRAGLRRELDEQVRRSDDLRLDAAVGSRRDQRRHRDQVAAGARERRDADVMATGGLGACRIEDHPVGREVHAGGRRVAEHADVALRRADQRARLLGGDRTGVIAEDLEGHRRAGRLRRRVFDVAEELLEILRRAAAAPSVAASESPNTPMPEMTLCSPRCEAWSTSTGKLVVLQRIGHSKPRARYAPDHDAHTQTRKPRRFRRLRDARRGRRAALLR